MYEKIITTKHAQLRLHPQWRKWLARWALYIDTKVVGSSLSQVAFSSWKRFQIQIKLWLDYGLGCATCDVLKVFIHCKSMITMFSSTSMRKTYRYSGREDQ